KIIWSVKRALDTRTALVSIDDTNKAIDKINAEQGTNIEQIRHVDEAILTEWVQVAKHGLKAMRVQERLKDDKQVKEVISKVISTQCERIDGDVSRMLASILDKPTNKIRINRVLEVDTKKHILHTEPDIVLDKTHKHFEEQFKERKIGTENNIKDEFYTPLKEVKEEWYKSLGEEITLEEWLAAVNGTKNQTVSGATGIG
ncbi:1880_t:CDS:2, partial [Dentiscutata heterogama]